MVKVYIVMSTHENESAYDLHSAHRTEKGADKGAIKVAEDMGHETVDDAGMDGLEIWIEGMELEE